MLWIDFFGVICSEVAPFWFKKYFSEGEVDELKDRFFKPLDLGEISNDELFNKLSILVEKPNSDISSEINSLVKINQDVVDCLRTLKNSHKIILCSNAGKSFLDRILKENNLEDIFDARVISSEIKVAKPDKKFFDICLEVSNSDKKDILFIDDNPVNVDAAARFGVKAILFTGTSTLSSMHC